MCDECTWHHKTFLVQSVHWHLAIKLYCMLKGWCVCLKASVRFHRACDRRITLFFSRCRGSGSLLGKSCCFSWRLDFHVWQKLHGSFSWNDCQGYRFKRSGGLLDGCVFEQHWVIHLEVAWLYIIMLCCQTSASSWRWLEDEMRREGRCVCPWLSSMLALWVSDSSDRHK